MQPATSADAVVSPSGTKTVPQSDERILDAVLAVLARDGVSGVSMRAVAREAGVAVGLANYHFDSKTALITAALERIGQQDGELVASIPGADPAERLRNALRQVLDPAFLATDYLGLRLQLWSLASVDPRFAKINEAAQLRYRSGLGELIAAARPELSPQEVDQKATDILIIQNGVWLTSLLIVNHDIVQRSLQHCEKIAFDNTA